MQCRRRFSRCRLRTGAAVSPELIPNSLTVAERLDRPAFKLEGNDIIAIDIGHTDTDHHDLPSRAIDRSRYRRRRYLQRQSMLALYPDRINPGSLWGSANAAKARTTS